MRNNPLAKQTKNIILIQVKSFDLIVNSLWLFVLHTRFPCFYLLNKTVVWVLFLGIKCYLNLVFSGVTILSNIYFKLFASSYLLY